MTAQQAAFEPGTSEWLKVITASKVAAILGLSPWDSPRSMWHKMRSDIPRDEQNKVQARGHYLEPAIIAWWRDEHPEYPRLEVKPVYRLDGWAAATPELAAAGDGVPDVLVEAKSVRDLDEPWGEPGTDLIPAYYLAQVYWQMHLSGVRRTFVPVIGPFLDFYEYVVDYDEALGADLEARCRAFYESLQSDVPPPLDDTTATYDAIRKLHPDIDNDATVQLTAEEACEYVEAMNGRREAEARERAAKSQVIDRMGDARFALCGDVKVARRQPNKTGVQLNQVAKSTDIFPEGTTTS